MRALESGTWLFGTATLAALALGASSQNDKTKSLLYFVAIGTGISAISMYITDLSETQRAATAAAAARPALGVPIATTLTPQGSPPTASLDGQDFFGTTVGIKRPYGPPARREPPAPSLPPSTAPPSPRISCGELRERWQRAIAMGQAPAITSRLQRLHEECCADLYRRWQAAIAMGQSPAIVTRLKNLYDQQCASIRA